MLILRCKNSVLQCLKNIHTQINIQACFKGMFPFVCCRDNLVKKSKITWLNISRKLASKKHAEYVCMRLSLRSTLSELSTHQRLQFSGAMDFWSKAAVVLRSAACLLLWARTSSSFSVIIRNVPLLFSGIVYLLIFKWNHADIIPSNQTQHVRTSGWNQH